MRLKTILIGVAVLPVVILGGAEICPLISISTRD